MEFPDPWDVADAMGAPSKEEARREMFKEFEQEQVENGCPICGKSIDEKPYTFDENLIPIHVDCYDDVKKHLAFIKSDSKRISEVE